MHLDPAVFLTASTHPPTAMARRSQNQNTLKHKQVIQIPGTRERFLFIVYAGGCLDLGLLLGDFAIGVKRQPDHGYPCYNQRTGFLPRLVCKPRQIHILCHLVNLFSARLEKAEPVFKQHWEVTGGCQSQRTEKTHLHGNTGKFNPFTWVFLSLLG